MKSNSKKVLFWVAVALVLLALFVLSDKSRSTSRAPELTYDQFVQKVQKGEFSSAVVEERVILARDKSGQAWSTPATNDPFLVSDMVKSGMTIQVRHAQGPSLLFTLLVSFGPVLLLVGVMVYMARQQSRGGMGGNGMFGFGKSRARKQSPDAATVTFADVAGCDEAKEEVAELVDFLKDPARFESLGGRIPRGVLLSGPPGTGKTLLARAIAGEAKVPFFSISGSDFVEMFVGVGAARVRDLFEQAKQNAPCIIFVDEIDAVGRARGAGVGGGNDEREQTLNQMLVEMDGFEGNLGVIVIAATNRPDILDAALTRPGRFDRQVVVGLPDVRGREQILNVHLRKVPVGRTVNASTLARGSSGFSGADLANLVNEAALFAARRQARVIEMEDFERAKDKIMMGPERRGLVMPEEERRNTAYHEAGHALAALLLPKCDPVHKVTIVPRGRALGLTMQLPEQDRYSTDRVRLESTLAVLFGGRVAEELFMGQATTGASNDYERATAIARSMVTKWGYSPVLGPMVVGADTDSMTGASLGRGTVSEDTLRAVDGEVRRILTEQYERVRQLLSANAATMHAMAAALLEFETLDAEQVRDILAGRPVRRPEPPASPSGTAPGVPGSGPSGGAAAAA